MVEVLRKGYVEQKYPRLSLSVLLAATSIFFSLSAAHAQEGSGDGRTIQSVTKLDSPFSLNSQENRELQPLSELLGNAFSDLQKEFHQNHPEATIGESLAVYYHQQASSDSGSLLNDHTFQKLVTLETLSALAGVRLPDPYYESDHFRQRERDLLQALTQMQATEDHTGFKRPSTIAELLQSSARLAQLSEFGIYLHNFATVEQKGNLLLLQTTQETQVASIGITFMARHFWSAVQRQQVYAGQKLTEAQWLNAIVDSFAYFEGLKAMNPYSGAQTDERFAYHLESEVAHFGQFAPYTLESIDIVFKFEFEKLMSQNEDPFPVGLAGQSVPYTFYTYPADDDHARGFDPMHLPANVLFGQKFDDGSAFIIYSSGESRAGLSIHDKLAAYQNRHQPTFENWWGSMPRKAELAIEVLPAARFDESNRLAAALMHIPFSRLVNYAKGDLSTEAEALYEDLMRDEALGFEEFTAGKQKLAFLLLFHRANPSLTHPILQRGQSRYQVDLRSELFDPLAFQDQMNELYEDNAAEDEIPFTYLSLNKMRNMSTFQQLADFGIVSPTYQHTGFELSPELLATAAEYLVYWPEDGSINIFKVDESQTSMTMIEITVDGLVEVKETQPVPDLRAVNLYAIPGM